MRWQIGKLAAFGNVCQNAEKVTTHQRIIHILPNYSILTVNLTDQNH